MPRLADGQGGGLFVGYTQGNLQINEPLDVAQWSDSQATPVLHHTLKDLELLSVHVHPNDRQFFTIERDSNQTANRFRVWNRFQPTPCFTISDPEHNSQEMFYAKHLFRIRFWWDAPALLQPRF
ncbi:MAG: hypothetical protein KDA84_16285 [Planctomycetaceae bacterium]|nr:hypothetical protein [Planctomycetaceae bacterium]